jgi:hypothetical protein
MLARECLTLVLLLSTFDATAQTTTPHSHRWSVSTMRTSWKAEPWGTACGPKPNTTSEPGGIVSIVQQGNELSITGLGRTYVSTNCWENLSGGITSSHSATTSTIRTVCQSPPGDPRRYRVTTTFTILGDKIEFNESGTFEYSIENASCRAVMQRSRTYSLIEREETPQPLQSPPFATTESQSLKAARLDAGAKTKVQVTVDIVSEARYRELLAAGTFNAAGETKDSVVTTEVSSRLGTKHTVVEASAQERRRLFVWTIGGLALALAVATLWLTVYRRKPRRTPSSAIPEPSADRYAPDECLKGARDSANTVLICPTCHDEYPNDQKFCAVDGNRLIEIPSRVNLAGAEGGVCPVCHHGYDPGVTRCPTHDEELVPTAALLQNPHAAASAGRRICPVCGSLYGPETQFCGNDGAALVPIN